MFTSRPPARLDGVVSNLSKLRKRRRLALLVVPALLLRALIPGGFMPVADAGGLSIELCPGAGALPPGIAAHGHAAHAGHEHAGHGTNDPGAAHHAACLFSTGASTTFAATLPASALSTVQHGAALEGAPSRAFVPAILRAQSSRAPPPPA